MSIADLVVNIGIGIETEKPEFKIWTKKDLIKETHLALGDLTEPEPLIKSLKTKPYLKKIKLTPNTKLYQAYKELKEKEQTEIDIKLFDIIKDNLEFGIDNRHSLKNRKKMFKEGLDSLKILNHPNILVLKNSYVILTQRQTESLYKEMPTCNECEKEMKKTTGKYGDFYFCENKCKNQKTVSNKYWKEIKKNK